MKVGVHDDQGLALLSQSALRQCYALMAGKLTPSSREPPHQWNQAPVPVIYQRKIKGREGLEERHNLKAEQSEYNHLESIVLGTWSRC